MKRENKKSIYGGERRKGAMKMSEVNKREIPNNEIGSNGEGLDIRREIVLGLDTSDNKVVTIPIVPVENTVILGTHNPKKRDYVEHIASDMLKNYTEKDLKLFMIDLDNDRRYQRLKDVNDHFALICTELDDVLALLEVIYEEIKTRLDILSEYNVLTLKDVEVKKRVQDPYYVKPPVMYVFVTRIDYLRLKMRDLGKGKTYEKYLDELLEFISKHGVKCDIGLILSGTTYDETSFPMDCMYNMTLKIGIGLTAKDHENMFKVRLENADEYNPGQNTVYIQTSRSILDILELRYTPYDEINQYKEMVKRGELNESNIRKSRYYWGLDDYKR